MNINDPNKTGAAPEGAKDANTRDVMQAIGRGIEDAIPAGWGFFVMVFPFNDEPGRMNYVSNAQRETITPLMREFIAKSEGCSLGGHR